MKPKNPFKISALVKTMKKIEFLIIEDIKGRKYGYDGVQFYRLMPLKGRK